MTRIAINQPCFSLGRAKSPSCARGFSLTELLVVMGILMILLAAAAPVFMKSSQRARQTAREMVKGHLQRARSHAIATGASTAVIVPDYSAGSEIGGKMLGIAEVNWVSSPTASGGAYQVSQMLQRWESLPGSVHVLSQATTRHPRITIMEQSLRSPVMMAGKAISGAVIVFSPTGQIISPANGAMEIVLGQGSVKAGQVTATEKTGNRVSYDLLQINRLTGRTRQIDPL
jgi:prepilin-type N-terminal cleavage/methylation domain-containing protein